MKIYQILFFTLSTVSIIHCSQQSDQNEDSKASYHIEFEDKSPNGGYGYKVQVSGKSKYQETWKKDKNPALTSASIATGPLNYSQTNDASSSNDFVPKVQPSTKPVENNFVKDSYSSNPVTNTNQYSSKSAFKLSSQDSGSFKSDQVNKASSSSSSFVPHITPSVDSAKNQQFHKTPKYPSENSFASYDQHVSKPELQAALESQTYKSPVQYSSSDDFGLNSFQAKPTGVKNQQFHKTPTYSSENSFASYDQHVSKPELQAALDSQTYESPVQFSSSDDFVPINFHESKSSQNGFNSQNYASNNQDWQVSSNQYSNKPSLQIMNQYSDSNHNFVGSGPHVNVESIFGKVNHQQFANQYASKPQVSLSSEADLSNYYSQSPKILYQNSMKSTVAPQSEFSAPIEYYQPTRYPKANFDYTNQYAPEIPSETLSHSVNIPEINSNGNINYNPLKYSSQYQYGYPDSSALLNQYNTIQGISYSDNNAQKPTTSTIQHTPQISTVPSHQFTIEEMSYSKDNSAQKSTTPTVQYGPQISTVPSHQYTIEEIPYSKDNSVQKSVTSTVQYGPQISTVPSHQYTIEEIPYSKDNSGQKSTTPSVQYTPQISTVPSHQFTIEGKSYSKDNYGQKPITSTIQYAPQISRVPSTQFVSEQEIKHSKDNRIHKSVPSSVKYVSQYQPQYVPAQEVGYSVYQPSVSTNQYASVPSTQFAAHSQENILQKPTTFTSQYASSSVPLTQYASQENIKYVPQQNIPSLQEKPSVQLPIDYSQFLQQYPQFSQETLASLQTESKEIPQQNFYNAVQQPVVNTQEVSYHYKQELPPTTSQKNISPNNLNFPNAQYVTLSSYTPKDMENTYNTFLAGLGQQNGQQSLAGLGNIDSNGIPLNHYGVYGNSGTGNGNNQNLYAPGLAYGYGSNIASDQGLLNPNGYAGTTGGLQFANTYNVLRRSSGKKGNNKKYVSDQKQTE